MTRRPVTPPESPKSNSSRSEMRVSFNEEKPKEIPRSPVSEKGEEGGGAAEVKDEGPKRMSRWKSWKQRKKLQGAGKEKGAESNLPKKLLKCDSRVGNDSRVGLGGLLQ